MFVFIGCNDDDEPSPSSGNANANTRLVGTANIRSNGEVVRLGSAMAVNEGHVVMAVSEGNINLNAVTARMEIPQLRGGDNNLFIVHTVSNDVNYCIEWNYTLRAQRWSAFRWDRSNSGGNAGYSGNFQEDPLIPAPYRTTLNDHYANGYDRGHIVGSADRQRTWEANEQTFYLSNMQPQLRGFNSKKNGGYSIWYNLENRLRNTYNQDSFRDTLYVVKGGTIGDGQYTTTKNQLPVPKYFFMALLRKRNDISVNGGYAAIGFYMEHKEHTGSSNDTNFEKYAVSIKRLEELTQIDFFCNLPDAIEHEVESSYSSVVWLR